jgi:N-acylneuraminate cytidylyltransferase
VDTLFLIPARAGSKGLPNKNKKLLNGKPLICYTIEFALLNAKSNDVICITTDDAEIIEIVKTKYNLEVPFVRPSKLSDDKANTFDVIIHALDFYENNNISFNKILLLQPTSPLRIQKDFEIINQIYGETQADMVVTVKKSKENPYFTLFEENNEGNLIKIKSNSEYTNRQDCPSVYVYNGSMYLVNTKIFLQLLNFNFVNIKKYEMPDSRSIDIDTQADWILAEYYLNIMNENS